MFSLKNRLTAYAGFKKTERAFRYKFRAARRDALNRLLYGHGTPRYAERIWVNPQDCTKCLLGLGDRFSGKVITSDWPPPDAKIMDIENLYKVNACLKHWRDGLSWEDTGIYDHLLQAISEHPRRCFDGCRNFNEVKARYEALDKLFEKTQSTSNLVGISDKFPPLACREKDGVCFHIGPGGELFFGGNGCHRFALSLTLKLPVIPAKIGCVHIRAIPFLDSFRAAGTCLAPLTPSRLI